MNQMITTSGGSMTAPVFSADLIARFIDYTDVNDVTMKGYITCIRAFVRWMHAEGITQPRREDVKRYKEYLERADFTAGTRAQYMRGVKHFFKWTAAEGLYPNVADNIKIKGTSTRHKKDALGRDDVPAIADSIDRSTEQGKRLYAIYLLCVVCGLRTIEVSRAKVEDIKTTGGKSYLWVWGKGHQEPDTPVLLIPEVKAALDDYMGSRTDKPTGKSPLFVSTSNRSKGQPIAATTISTTIKGLMRGAGYDSDRLTAHSLRHSSGTAAYKATHNLYLAQQHQRHADPATTEIYIHDEERDERNTEELVYNYYFNPSAKDDPAAEAIGIIRRLAPSKLQAALTMLRAMC